LAKKDKIAQWKIANRRVFSKYYRIFCFCFEHIFYRLGVFMPGVLTPIFARREGRGPLATDIITFS